MAEAPASIRVNREPERNIPLEIARVGVAVTPRVHEACKSRMCGYRMRQPESSCPPFVIAH